MLDPLKIIQELLKVDQKTAVFLLTGLGLLSVIGAALAANIDAETFTRYAIILLVITFLCRTIVAIPIDGLLTRLAGWVLVIFFFAFTAYAVASGLFSAQTGLAPLSKTRAKPPISFPSIKCLLQPFADCQALLDAEAVSTDKAPVIKPVDEAVTPTPAPAAIVDKLKYTIYVQFAGYQRETVVKMAAALQATGWKIPRADLGGERLAAAAGLAQVRYSADADKAAAELLASDINQTGIKSGVKATQNPVITPGVLEVWIGQ